MQTYSQFAPTPFDHAGAFLPDQQQWLVAPVSQTRDSGPLDKSNFAAFLEAIGGESDDAQVHRFGHWGPGWFELILINPANSAIVAKAEELESALADYPCLDEDDYSAREWERAQDSWNAMSTRDRVNTCARFGVSIFAARRDDIPQDDCGSLFQYLAE